MTTKSTVPRTFRGSAFDASPYSLPVVAVGPEVMALKQAVFDHPAARILASLEEKLSRGPLDRDRMRILLASEGSFVLELPPAIVALSSRITDHYFAVSPFQATGIAARVLYAAVDEYGLNEMSTGLLPSHHLLYAEMAAHWQITQEELTDPRYVVPEAARMAKTVNAYYRHRPLFEAMGCHIANETSAPLDFGVLSRYFKRFAAEFDLDANGRILGFLTVHEDVEESHCDMGLEVVQMLMHEDPTALEQAHAGVQAYMDAYLRMFAQLEEVLFP